LSKGLITQMVKKDEFYVTILGLDDSGKTTFLERVKSIFNDSIMPQPSKISPTVGMNIGKIDHRRIRLIFWDVGGQAELQTLWDKYISECHAIIYIIDASNEERIEESEQAFRKVVAFDRVSQLPLLILFNKCDEEKEIKEEDESNNEREKKECTTKTTNLEKFRQSLAETTRLSSSTSATTTTPPTAGENGTNGEEMKEEGELAIMSISAKDNLNIEKSIKWLGEAINRRYIVQS
jgi:ADP-ribosylation factor related protein 1